jgi:hypothetical protein
MERGAPLVALAWAALFWQQQQQQPASIQAPEHWVRDNIVRLPVVRVHLAPRHQQGLLAKHVRWQQRELHGLAAHFLL